MKLRRIKNCHFWVTMYVYAGGMRCWVNLAPKRPRIIAVSLNFSSLIMFTVCRPASWHCRALLARLASKVWHNTSVRHALQ